MIEQEFTFTCDACGIVEAYRINLHSWSSSHLWNAPAHAVIPENWIVIDNKIFCDRHEIKIDDEIFSKE